MKKIGMKFISGFISMIMMVNLIMPMGVYASVDVTDETVIEETVDEETITQEEDLTEQLTTASGAETAKEEEETKEEETVSETGEEEKVSKPFNESKTIGDVTITVEAEAGAFPDGSYLTVKEIASNIDLSSDDETLAASYSYDITIYDKDDNEIEPAEGKNVSVSFSMDKIADSNLDTNIYHTSDDGTVTELDITTSGDTATVATDSFSVYTVEFTYGELTYVMNGDSTIKISDILNSVGLTGVVSSVECSDTSLFSASDESGEWIISSHKAFSTTEWMKVTIEDIVYEIKVTDAQTGTCGTNVTWTLDGDTLTISGTGAMADYTTTSNAPWYSQKDSITTVVISDGVTSIGDYAFAQCSSLTSITIPSSVTSIGRNAFDGCSSLSSITIPSGVTSIGRNAFDGCSSLSSITIPTSVTSIGSSAFAGCSSLSSITIPNGVTSIGDFAFYECTGLTSITIPNGVTSIGDFAFYECTGLTSITIPTSVTSIGGNAFYRCSRLTSITIPASVNSIGSYAFTGIADGAVIYYEGTQTDLDKVTGKNNISSPKLKLRSEGGNCGANGDNVKWSYYNDGTLVISGTGAMADYNSSSNVPWYSKKDDITTVVISDGVTSIGNRAFYNCDKLTSITIPSGVTSIGDYAFYNCDKLTSITIPTSVKSIGDYAFVYCTKLTSITIPTSVKSIGNGAFNWCTGLTSITIPSSVTSIANFAFESCSNLTSIMIPDSVTSIGSSAFHGCSNLSSITIPASVNSIGTGAFDGIASNAVIDFGGTQAQWDSFGVTLATTVTVRCALLAAGNCGANGDNVKWILKNDGTLEISGTGDIANYYYDSIPWYSQKDSITTVVISDGVTSIGRYAFFDCNKLTSITIPTSVTSIGNKAFYECTGLTSITIPNGVTSIGNYAFYSCTSLDNITIPNSVTSIGEDAFRQCSSITGITIPASVTSIGDRAFKLMGNAATDPTINFGGTKARWDAFGRNIEVGNNVTVNCTKFDITIKAKDQSVALGGAVSNTLSDVTVTGSLDTGHTLEGITLTADTSNATTSGVITPKNAVIKAGTTDINVEDNYNITYVNGTLTVTKGNPVVTAPTAKTGLVYDGTEKELVQAGSTTGGTLKYSLSATGTYTADIPKAKNAGPYTVFYKVEGNDNYNGDNGGSVAVTIGTKPLTITAGSDSKTYDGTALTKNSYTNTALASGDNISSVTITGSQTVFGNSNNVASAAVIKNTAGTDVTSSYNITYTNGTLNVTKRDVTVSVADKTVSYNTSEQTGNTSYTFANVAAGDTATITYTPAKGTDASATAYDNGSFADDFKVMSGSTDVTSSYNLKSKTAGKLKINKAAITPTVNIKGWIVGNTPDIPTVTGNKGNGTETIEYKKSTEADTAYTGTVPTAEGTYTVRATIDETANYQGATVTAEFKISAKPVVVTDDDSDKKNDNEEGSSTNEETGYEAFMKELKAAAKKGTPQTLTLNWGNSLSYEAMQILKDNPQLTLIFNYKWQGADYSTTIGGGRTVYANKAISWYGPENLRGLYGASLGRRYANSKGNAVTNTVNTPNNGVYVVQRGDSLWKIANRKLHVSVDYLVQKNNIVNRNRIRTGQVLYY